MPTQEYYDYISSDQWRELARFIRRRDRLTCQDCGARNVRLDVHHLTYDRLFHESLDDLIALCRRCHDARHGRVVGPLAAPPAKSKRRGWRRLFRRR